MIATEVATLVAEAEEALAEFRAKSLTAARARSIATTYAETAKGIEAATTPQAYEMGTNEMARKAALANLLAENVAYLAAKESAESAKREAETAEIEATAARYRLGLRQAQIAFQTALLSAPL